MYRAIINQINKYINLLWGKYAYVRNKKNLKISEVISASTKEDLFGNYWKKMTRIRFIRIADRLGKKVKRWNKVEIRVIDSFSNLSPAFRMRALLIPDSVQFLHLPSFRFNFLVCILMKKVEQSWTKQHFWLFLSYIGYLPTFSPFNF